MFDNMIPWAIKRSIKLAIGLNSLNLNKYFSNLSVITKFYSSSVAYVVVTTMSFYLQL